MNICAQHGSRYVPVSIGSDLGVRYEALEKAPEVNVEYIPVHIFWITKYRELFQWSMAIEIINLSWLGTKHAHPVIRSEKNH